jgi:hypothetical protein
MNNVIDQLARNTGLLPDDLATAILAGDTPPVEDIVISLVIGAMDAHAVVVGDPESSWNEKRLARMALAVAFLAAMAVAERVGSGNDSGCVTCMDEAPIELR